jgi:DUF4097 and DUF4098 domain-containing protein YvlB
MRTKFLGTVLIVLVLLGGVQVFQNLTRSAHHGNAADIIESVSAKISDIEFDGQSQDAVTAEVMIEKSFKVRSGSALLVDISHANVDVQTGSGNEASVLVTLNSRNMGKARDKFEKMEWAVYEEGGNVHVTAESPRGNWNVSMNIEVTIVIPSTFDVDLSTSHGNVDMDDIEGMVNLKTSHGNVEFAEINGKRLDIASSHGNIKGYSIKAASVNLETSHANISVKEIDADEVNASTSHANIDIQYLNGEASISTSHGNIDVFLAGEENASFETQHGNIEVTMSSGAGAELDLRAPNIRLDREMKVRGEKTRERVEGSVFGGGRSIRARTTHGNIELSSK